MESVTLDRKERIKMFIYEYYFGVSILYTISKIVGGPFLCYTGWYLYHTATDKFSVGYGWFILAFSFYFTLRPVLWVLVKWPHFKTTQFELEVTHEKLIMKSEKSLSESEYSEFKKIAKRPNYFVFWITKGLKIYLPFKNLQQESVAILDQKLTR